jgi:hypothetical protein
MLEILPLVNSFLIEFATGNGISRRTRTIFALDNAMAISAGSKQQWWWDTVMKLGSHELTPEGRHQGENKGDRRQDSRRDRNGTMGDSAKRKKRIS